MRLALLALPLVLTVAAPAWAASISSDVGMGCRELDYQKRIARAAGAGDRDGLIALINRGIATGACVKLAKGLRVRIEETSFPYACVVKFGTADKCLWVTSREVDTRD